MTSEKIIQTIFNADDDALIDIRHDRQGRSLTAVPAAQVKQAIRRHTTFEIHRVVKAAL